MRHRGTLLVGWNHHLVSSNKGGVVTFVYQEGHRAFLLIEYFDEKGKYVLKKAEFVRKIRKNPYDSAASDEVHITYGYLTIDELLIINSEKSKYRVASSDFGAKEIRQLETSILNDIKLIQKTPRYQEPSLKGHDCLTWVREKVQSSWANINFTWRDSVSHMDFDISRCDPDKVRFYIRGKKLRPNTAWYNPFGWRPYSRKEILDCLPKNFLDGPKRFCDEEDYGRDNFTKFCVEAPEWFELVLYDKPAPKEVSSRVIQRILSVTVVKPYTVNFGHEDQTRYSYKEILCNYAPPSNTWSWVIGSLLFSAAVVGSLVWKGIITEELIAFAVGAANLLLIGLVKKGLDWYRRTDNTDTAAEELDEDENDFAQSYTLQPQYDHSESKGMASQREMKSAGADPHLAAYIKRQLKNYDRQKGTLRHWLGDPNDINRLKQLMNRVNSNTLSSQDMLSLCKLMMEETTQIGQPSYNVFNNIKLRMTKRGEKYLPLVAAQFLQYVNLLNQDNFDRFLAFSPHEQMVVCKIMQSVDGRHRTQNLFNFAHEHAGYIRNYHAAGKMMVFILEILPPALHSKDNYRKLFALADDYYRKAPDEPINSDIDCAQYCEQFFAIFLALPAEQLTQANLNFLCNLPRNELQSLQYVMEKIPFSRTLKGFTFLKTQNDYKSIVAMFKDIGIELIDEENFEIICRKPLVCRIFKRSKEYVWTKQLLRSLVKLDDNGLQTMWQGIEFYDECQREIIRCLTTNNKFSLDQPEKLKPFLQQICRENSCSLQTLMSEIGYYEEYFLSLLGYVTPVQQKMEALCQGLHPRLGQYSWVRLFAGPNQQQPMDPMSAISDRNVISLIKQFL